MTKPMRTFAVAVALAVTTTAVIGTVTGSDEAEAATQHTLRIPAAAFKPLDPATEYLNYGSFIFQDTSVREVFVAPVFLQGNSATIQSIRLTYRDSGSGEVCAWLIRPHLKAGGEKTMGGMCSRNAASGLRTRTDTTINPDTVGPDNSTYLFATLSKGGNYLLFGVTIVYTSDV